MAAFGNILGRLVYLTEVETGTLKRGLAEGVGEVEAATRAIDAMNATVEIKADITNLEKKAIATKAIIHDLEKEQARLNKTGGDTERLDEVTKSLQQQRGALRDINYEMSQRKRSLRVHEQERRLVTATTKAYNDQNMAVRKQAADLARLRSEYGRLRGEYTRARRSTGLFTSAREQADLDRFTSELELHREKIVQLGGDTADLDRKNRITWGSMGRWSRMLGETRVHLGFFSASLRAVAAGLVLLGPALWSVVGSAASLIGVLGTGLTGALAVGGAATAGFLLAFGGMFAAIHGHTDQLKKDFHELGQTFQGRTGKTRQNFAEALASGMKAANALLPTFARNTNKASTALTAGWNEWMRGMRSGEAKRLLDQTMKGFTGSIDGVMDGLGSIGTMFGRIAASAAQFLPGLSKGFANWAESLKDSVGSGDSLDAHMKRLVEHMRSVGHFAQASGRLLVNFFNGGANSGRNLLKSLTSTFNRWSEWMESARGQNEMAKWFDQMNGLMRQLAPALVRLGAIFFKFSNISAPFLGGFLTALNSFLEMVNRAPKPIQYLVSTLIGLWFVLSKLAPLLSGLMLARTAAGMSAMAASTTAASAATSGMATTAPAAAVGLRGMGMAALRLAGPIGAIITASYLLVKLTGDNTTASEEFAAKTKALSNAARELAPAVRQATSAQEAYSKAWKDDKSSAAELARVSQQRREALQQEAAAVKKAQQAQRDATQGYQEYLQARRDLRKEEQNDPAADTWRKAYYDQQRAQLGKLRPAVDAYRLALLNVRRAQEGMAQMAPSMGKLLGQFRQNFGKKATLQIGLIGNKRVASEMATLANKAAALGHKQQVLKILASTESAEEKLRDLREAAQRTTKEKRTMRWALDAAAAMAGLNRLDQQGKKVEKPRKIRVDADTSGAEARLNSIEARIRSLPDGQVTVYTHYVDRGRHSAEGGMRGFAGGGSPSSNGGKYNSPTYLVGEEKKQWPEWVIATNPAYRRSNMNYLSAAASALGAALVPAFAGGGNATAAGGKKKGKYPWSTSGVPSKPGPHARESNYEYYHNLIDYFDAMYTSKRAVFESKGQLRVGDDAAHWQELVNYQKDKVQAYVQLKKVLDAMIERYQGVMRQKLPGGKSKQAKNRRDKAKERKQNAKSQLQSLYKERSFEYAAQKAQAGADLQNLLNERDGKNVSGGLGGAQTTGEALALASSERYQLYKDFASNVLGGGWRTFGTGVSGVLSGVGGPGLVASNPTYPQSQGVAPTPQKNVNITNNFQEPPPDPHTWTNGVAWEAGVA